MTANPQDFAYFLRGELPKPTKGSNNTTGFDHFNRAEIFPATIPNTVTGTAAATLGALSATAAGTPKVTGTASAPLGALTASATGTPTVRGTLAATLGALTATATGTPKVTGTASATLGTLAATATGADVPVSHAPAGGNLTKPRLHLGNFPGRKELAADGQLLYTLTLTGDGELDTPATYSLPMFSGEGEIVAEAELILHRATQGEGSVTATARLDVNTARRGTGTCSEDADDILVLLSL